MDRTSRFRPLHSEAVTYETILTCPKCGTETRLVADEVVADRDRYRDALETLLDGNMLGAVGARIVWDALDPEQKEQKS